MTSRLISDKKLQALVRGRCDDFVLLESTKVSEENSRSFLFDRPLEILVCTLGDDPESFLRQATEKLGQGYYLAGWFGYEFGYMLEPVLAGLAARSSAVVAQLGVFKKPYIFDHLTGTFDKTGGWPDSDDFSETGGFEVGSIDFNMERDEYCSAVRKIKQYIESGDTYQVNFTLQLAFELSGDHGSFYQALRHSQHVGYGAYIRFGDTDILSFSPELFFRKTDKCITVRPMKGTMKRGRTVTEDEKLRAFLRQDIKNRSENVMIVDLLRNDIGRLCIDGRVEVKSLFDVETFESLHQMTSTVEGALKPEISLVEIFRALFPCGSVTGAPKIRTMEIIRELEKEGRGVYTGAIGYLAPDGSGAFNVPIRSVVLKNGNGTMGIGSGIVYDSDPVREWEECLLKGEFLTSPRPRFRLIETILWTRSAGYWLLDLHCDRLLESAGYFSFPVDRLAIIKLLEKEALSWEKKGDNARRVRLTVGSDGDMAIESTVIDEQKIHLGFDQAGTETSGDLPRVLLGKERTDSSSPYLFHKTTYRQLYDNVRSRAVEAGYLDVLFCNDKGELTEGAIANIFIRKGDVFLTPPVRCGLLPGVFRRWLLDSEPRLREKILFPEELESADAVYIGNSVRGLVEVIVENEE